MRLSREIVLLGRGTVGVLGKDPVEASLLEDSPLLKLSPEELLLLLLDLSSESVELLRLELPVLLLEVELLDKLAELLELPRPETLLDRLTSLEGTLDTLVALPEDEALPEEVFL